MEQISVTQELRTAIDKLKSALGPDHCKNMKCIEGCGLYCDAKHIHCDTHAGREAFCNEQCDRYDPDQIWQIVKEIETGVDDLLTELFNLKEEKVRLQNSLQTSNDMVVESMQSGWVSRNDLRIKLYADVCLEFGKRMKDQKDCATYLKLLGKVADSLLTEHSAEPEGCPANDEDCKAIFRFGMARDLYAAYCKITTGCSLNALKAKSILAEIIDPLAKTGEDVFAKLTRKEE